MTVKKETLANLIKQSIPNVSTINTLKTRRADELGNTVYYIEANVTLEEKTGKQFIHGKETINLIYIVDTATLLTTDWTIVA